MLKWEKRQKRTIKNTANNQMKALQIIQPLLLCGVLFSCNRGNNPSSLSLGKGKDVTVSLTVIDSKGINKIEFRSNGDHYSVKAKELAKYKTIHYGFNGPGEGTFKLVVYTNLDTLKSEHYVERGFHVRLECDSSQIHPIDHGGIAY